MPISPLCIQNKTKCKIWLWVRRRKKLRHTENHFSRRRHFPTNQCIASKLCTCGRWGKMNRDVQKMWHLVIVELSNLFCTKYLYQQNSATGFSITGAHFSKENAHEHYARTSCILHFVFAFWYLLKIFAQKILTTFACHTLRSPRSQGGLKLLHPLFYSLFTPFTPRFLTRAISNIACQDNQAWENTPWVVRTKLFGKEGKILLVTLFLLPDKGKLSLFCFLCTFSPFDFL